MSNISIHRSVLSLIPRNIRSYHFFFEGMTSDFLNLFGVIIKGKTNHNYNQKDHDFEWTNVMTPKFGNGSSQNQIQ